MGSSEPPPSALSALAVLIFTPASESQREAFRAAAEGHMERTFYEHGDLVADKWHHYLEIYDRHLARYRGLPVRFLEIGIQNGGSLQIWRRYFGSKADIHGLDIDPRCADLPRLDATVTIGDQGDPAVLLSIANAEERPLDVVVDDGSHRWTDQIVAFETLFPLLAVDGVYVCEDVHTSFATEFGKEGDETFLDYVQRLVDQMHATYVSEEEAATHGIGAGEDGVESAGVKPAIGASIRGIHIYDSMVVVEKRMRPPPLRVLVGTETGW